jgi:chromosome segregation ATPase
VSSGGGKTGGGGGSSSPTPAGPSIAEIDRNITRLQQEFTKAQNEYNAAGAEVKRLRDAATPLQDRALKMRERVEPVGSAISAIETRMDEINRVLKSYEDKKIDLRESQALDLKMRKDTLEHELLVKNNEFATLEADYNKAAMDYKAAISKTYPVEEKMHSLDITIHNLKNNIAGWQAARNLMTRNVRDYK